jgi:predicted ATP-grasp superfamily ATP-dependent carboligase
LIVGASARAAAHSALRAGLTPCAADLFADRDLAAAARCARVALADYPEGLLDAAAAFPPGPWVYTGALENRPDLVDRLARVRPLWGNGAETLRSVRDPFCVARALREGGLPATDVRPDPGGLPRDGSWLRKPLRSAGGLGIAPLVDDTDGPPSYFQQRIEGTTASAVFVGQRTHADLVGVTRQLLGRPGAPFAYRGSLAPWPIAPGIQSQIERIGHVLAGAFGLVGLFGVDLVLDGERAWSVEVNPRYTASVEALELALRRPLLAEHRDACEGGPSGPVPAAGGAPRFVAKEILFATADVVITVGAVPVRLGSFEVPEAADIPADGTRFATVEPGLTVFAEGASPDEALARLADVRRRWEDRLRGSLPSGSGPG